MVAFARSRLFPPAPHLLAFAVPAIPPVPLRLGVLGLGRAFTLLLPALRADPRLRLLAAADPNPAARARFAAEIAPATFDTAEALAADPAIEAIYIATPHQYHAAHAIAACRAGKHVLVEKPMALTLADAEAMIAAAHAAKVALIVGPSHRFDAPIAAARALIASGRYGRVRMMTLLTATDFLYRPRRPEELDTAQGGGVVFNQAAHQLDIARLLGGGDLGWIRAATGAWDPARRTEGAYTALAGFRDGAVASLTYTGYARYDSDALMGWIGEDGRPGRPALLGAARARLGGDDESRLRAARGYATAPEAPAPAAHPHFGYALIQCEGADLRPTPYGVEIHADHDRSFHSTPPGPPPVLDALWHAIRHGRMPAQTGAWGLATLEACLGLLTSAREHREIPLTRQLALRDAAGNATAGATPEDVMPQPHSPAP